MHYLLFYEVGEDYVARRAQFREAHLDKAWAASRRGELVLGGALADPVDGAVLLFQGNSPAVAENFARVDPYVTIGLVKRWHVREWTTVVGDDAAQPVRPGLAEAASKPSTTSLGSTSTGPSAQEKGTILRMWKAHTSPEQADQYFEHATKKVLPALRAIEGHRGASLLRRSVDGMVEIVVMTLWDSMEAVEQFAGARPDQAVVDSKTRAILTDFDEFVSHFEIVHSAEGTEKEEP